MSADRDDIENSEKSTDETSKSSKGPVPLASIGEVFSFGQGTIKIVSLVLGSCFAVITGLSFPAMAFILADSFERLAGNATRNAFLREVREITFILMILGVVILVSMSMQGLLMETAAHIMTKDLKSRWFRALLRQDLAYYDIKDVSGTASIISSNGAKFKKGLGNKLAGLIQYIVTVIGGAAYAFYASWRASLVILGVLPFMVLSTLFLVKITTTKTTRANQSYADAGSIVYTSVSTIRTILSLNAVELMVKNFKEATTKAFEGAVKIAPLEGFATGTTVASFLLSYFAITLFGTYLLYDNVKKTGCDPSGTVPDNVTCDPRGADIFGALFGITFAASVMPQVSVSLEALTGSRAACLPAILAMRRKVGNDADARQASQVSSTRRGETTPLPKYMIDSSSDKGKKPKSVEGKIEFKNVTFSYPTRQETNVFDQFSLTVEAGTTVALVGPSGSGKSTSVQLVERFYDPLGGSVTLDGTDLKELNVEWLRQQIGLVSQEPSLFACSIRENISYGCPGATQEQIEEAARMANCHDFIRAFPDGYETNVGDKGAQLSGGQKQRIAIARVLVKNPKILLLDEATSALDSESEQVVQDALDNLVEGGGRTTIVIAHRLSTIRDADKIVVVNAGKVVETGTHDELVALGGEYFQLVEAQKGKGKGGSDSDPPSRRESTHEAQEVEQEEVHDKAVLKFRDVHFHYPARPETPIFRGLNLNVYEGETLALVGPSGHGKSTVIQLIERFYDPDQGSVELNGVDYRDINVRWLRDQIGLVSQEPTLFDTTIAENIRYGNPAATSDEIMEAAKQANIHDTIMTFPDQYETSVGVGGTQVSGGQKQRIAIARALLKKPKILLLDEATSALDSESEKVVQEALDSIMASKTQTTIVIAHRLSTIRDADRIAVIVKGRVREIGTHDELMENEDGHYFRLQMFQNLDTDQVMKGQVKGLEDDEDDPESDGRTKKSDKIEAKDLTVEEIDKDTAKQHANRAWLLAKEDRGYFFVGGIGAFVAGLVFPATGIIFGYMTELLYFSVEMCEDGVIDPPPPFTTCQDYWDDIADDIRQKSFYVAYGCLGTAATCLIGFAVLYYAFSTASERMNKRIRDGAFESLIRQEIAFFDVHPVAALTTKLSEDAALIHSFSGEPIRTLVMNISSVAVGVIVAFVLMWPFALLTLATLPFLGFGAEMEMKMYVGEDEGDINDEKENSPGAIVVETLSSIRTVASLTIEKLRAREFDEALNNEIKNPLKAHAVKGAAGGLGQFVQMWGLAFMIWWGGYLLVNYPDFFNYQDFVVAMFGLFYSLYGIAIAAEGATNREKAKLAAGRIFELMDRPSSIDPLSDEGKKSV